ncbi:TPA: amino acid transporter [Candidatus Sumerlaeota bacterium]|nr:amino acid transporter [Candidatus Sumerlaeota bacterium]
MGKPTGASPGGKPSILRRIKHIFLGAPRDIYDRSIYHTMVLAPLLAWIGLGADGLSSSSYGPDEAFRALGQHTFLAIGLALLTALTVIVISAAYSHLIEEFPHGGGGYLVATKLLGERIGLVSGAALLVDYVLTITVSVASASDALFSFLPPEWSPLRYETAFVIIIGLIILNIRGVKESVLVLTPIFVAFIILHVILIGGGILLKAPSVPQVAVDTVSGYQASVKALGFGGMLLLFIKAFSLGGGTYTGIEAVSNGLAVMREPRVATGKRTMLYMAASLAATAGGLLFCYLLWHVVPEKDKTMNASLCEAFVAGTGMPFGKVFIICTLVSEGALLIVAGLTGFIGGPRVLANMAVDGWAPRRFGALSQRLTTQNGVVLMGIAAIGALMYTHGNVSKLVVMYSINVFLTFSLSMYGMAKMWWERRKTHKEWRQRLLLFSIGLAFCAIILVITTAEKFTEGGWITLVVTGIVVAVFMMIRQHYNTVGVKLREVFRQLEDLPITPHADPGEVDPRHASAVVLVGGFSGLGIHTMMRIFKHFPGQFKNLVFLSVGVIDSGVFKGEGSVEALQERTEKSLERYVDLARRLGFPATSRMAMGTDATEEAEKLCLEVGKEFPNSVFFSGKLVFQREKWYQRFLHNETSFDLLKRLHEAGKLMVVIPAKVD